MNKELEVRLSYITGHINDAIWCKENGNIKSMRNHLSSTVGHLRDLIKWILI